MKHRIGGAAAVAVVAVLLLSSCGGQQPRSGSGGSESWGTAPNHHNPTVAVGCIVIAGETPAVGNLHPRTTRSSECAD